MKKILIGFALGFTIAAIIVVAFLCGMQVDNNNKESTTNILQLYGTVPYYEYGNKVPDFGALCGVKPKEFLKSPFEENTIQYDYIYNYNEVKDVYLKYLDVLKIEGYEIEESTDLSGVHTVYYVQKKNDIENTSFILSIFKEKTENMDGQYVIVTFHY